MEGLLFIDDEEGVRRSVARALKREPYDIFTVEDGRKEVSFVRENPARVCIVISDYKMPHMDGLETPTAIGAMNPEITRIILIGDSIMVVSGAPVAGADDALRAVQAAVSMQNEAAAVDRGLAADGRLRMRIGIGVASGRVFSGVLGSLRKKEYTCIGTAVNVAARLTAMAAPGQILISPGTYRKVAADIAADPMPEMVVKGIHSPMTVYRVC